MNAAQTTLGHTLSTRIVDVWLVPAGAIAPSSGLVDAYSALLSEEERERIARYHVPQERHVRLVARAALRALLARYTQKDARAWRFVRGIKGRPEIDGGDTHAAIQFSVSHAGGLIALSIALSNRLGTDVEDVRRTNVGDVLAVARRFFSSTEAVDIESRPRCMRRESFFEYWTLKEAYVKALGTGLYTPLDQVSFGRQDNGTLTVAFGHGARDNAGVWRFLLATVPPERRLAVAVQTRSQALHARLFAAIPLVEERLLTELAWDSPGRRLVLAVSPEDALL